MKTPKELDTVTLSGTLITGIVINNECNGWYLIRFKNGEKMRVHIDDIRPTLLDRLAELDEMSDVQITRIIKKKLGFLKPFINIIILSSLFALFVFLFTILYKIL